MDANIQRFLNDKLYDKRKVGALDLERTIRELIAAKDYAKIEAILDQLCNDYAYAVHQPHARNGGLIGLAAAAIALGPELPKYLELIVPPVLACFTDQDARVRYYACEAMYNIAKVAKGEILVYFNYIFDALCKLGADSELSVKNGAELLDRLVKDIVSESAATYVSVLQQPQDFDGDDKNANDEQLDLPTAFSLQKFIPLLRERIFAMNPFSRTFLVGWITLLDSIPDLELVTFLPEFLGGLLRFLSGSNRDVHVATQGCLDKFLAEIKRIAQVKKGITESKRSREAARQSRKDSIGSGGGRPLEDGDEVDSITANEDDDDVSSEDDWVPGQDVQINYKAILEILTATLDSPLEEDGLLESLRWIVEFLEICPEEVLPFTPKILAHLLPAMASGVESIRQAAARVNNSLMDYVVSLSDEADLVSAPPAATERLNGNASNRASLSSSRDLDLRSPTPAQSRPSERAPTPAVTPLATPQATPQADLDYVAAVNSLTLLFLNDHEATRVAALTWLIMLHRKAPRKVLAFNDGTFPALLKTLSDPAEAVVTKDLQLLSQISRNSEDDYFSNFMVNLLQLFSTDRKLLETRGNLIIRQLCTSLSAERIYRTLADCIEKEEDVEFASIMVQNLNNNLITAPELAELRKRLRNLETKDGQTFFVALFRSCAELEMTVNMLIQIDKLVQLLESPVFTYLRLQLLEPEKYPHLYKCLYGLLMLLPQSSAFAALKNRLNSVSSIGYLHIAPRPYVNSATGNGVSGGGAHLSHSRHGSVAEALAGSPSSTPLPSPTRKSTSGLDTHMLLTRSTATTPSVSTFDRPNRLKGRDDSIIRWTELLEKFRSVQERARRLQRGNTDDASSALSDLRIGGGEAAMDTKGTGREAAGGRAPPVPAKDPPVAAPPAKSRTLGRPFGRLGGAVAGRGKRAQQ
ncbi:armadillo-type protein [Pseudoneurospora amorphoporcata]|uniref:Armadillo-type protein n=1 Tax=Pseudoneurospora amorphoporcata TaxID=241081 RepID=A0AAN6SE30_9PEZI|nr:armadillo-type protein [Pseudoneurospora amorphoporcata]